MALAFTDCHPAPLRTGFRRRLTRQVRSRMVPRLRPGGAAATGGNPQSGPIFANLADKRLALGSIVKRLILPALNWC
jgi:hypothetical protein